ncbi:MAG: hypothetical protein HY658_09965, partial [Actinobacteria bacterium]|nr:hypothetical protein [Actinomycetota bacterium]
DGTLQGWPQPQMFGATVNICAQVSVQSGQIWSTKILPLEIDVDNGAPPNPTITTTSLPAATPGQPYQAQLQATGGDGSGYTWLLCPGWALPAGLALSATGLISGTPGPSAEPVAEVCFRVISGGSTGLVLGLGFTVGPGPDPVPGGSTVTLRKYKVEPTSLTIASGDSVEWVNRSGGRRTILSGNGKRVIAVLKPGTSASTRLVARRVHRFQVLQTGTVISVTVV